MVPFVEVVLLTAMEYNRKDKKKGKKTKKKGKGKTKNLQRTTLTVAPMKENMFDGEIKTGRLSLNCGIPSLKTLGKFQHIKQMIIWPWVKTALRPLPSAFRLGGNCNFFVILLGLNIFKK